MELFVSVLVSSDLCSLGSNSLFEIFRDMFIIIIISLLLLLLLLQLKPENNIIIIS